ncbi:hypothetical protein TNCT_307321 [Trichonephila clavata]|uniref:Uncharacterized protein n=1 Tax=Trichonephila clavata TaxID=2740835 RepID=A0A8X6FRD9_TRICU|nr:hypothetical protein TNCT_307321 [Trichonephila clavata]
MKNNFDVEKLEKAEGSRERWSSQQGRLANNRAKWVKIGAVRNVKRSEMETLGRPGRSKVSYISTQIINTDVLKGKQF